MSPFFYLFALVGIGVSYLPDTRLLVPASIWTQRTQSGVHPTHRARRGGTSTNMDLADAKAASARANQAVGWTSPFYVHLQHMH